MLGRGRGFRSLAAGLPPALLEELARAADDLLEVALAIDADLEVDDRDLFSRLAACAEAYRRACRAVGKEPTVWRQS